MPDDARDVTGESTAPVATFALIAIDCPDPVELTRFYSRITGWPLAPQRHDDWVEFDAGGAGATLAFQKISEGTYVPPEWPGQEHPQRAHIDLNVPDLDAGEAAVLALGARKHDVQPGPDSFRVFLDPIGQPFCLVIS
ncbi:VOC family protein [Pseudonocardia sp. HH130630-07]|uniref:VOC family protein n=1 Tax=Pseudonocardia sp. HH130630-07 TaxID=1690815 RepID=UPI0008152B3E|nr:VOC family protein [Pseudonocardia sp. HH130630-07]ANY06292.1 glyoxalase [Pseudonocardia sp. HH130630-07]